MYINNVVEHITVCWDMQKNSQCEALLCTFHKWTWPLFHSKHIFFESGCLLDSVPTHQSELVQVLLQALLKQQELGVQQSQLHVFKASIFGGKYQ